MVQKKEGERLGVTGIELVSLIRWFECNFQSLSWVRRWRSYILTNFIRSVFFAGCTTSWLCPCRTFNILLHVYLMMYFVV